MNTCRRCGDELPPLTTSVRCAYDMQNELNDWGLLPVGLSY